MCNNERKYIEYKLEGLLDSKELYEKKHTNTKIYGTLSQAFKEEYKISANDYDQFVDNNLDIQTIKAKCTPERKKGFNGIINFYDWYKQQDRKCGYCGITQNELYILFSEENRQLPLNDALKRSSGALEIERRNSKDDEYNEENCILACPLCNNAKSNLIDEENWKAIFVKPMRTYYEKLLKKELEHGI